MTPAEELRAALRPILAAHGRVPLDELDQVLDEIAETLKPAGWIRGRIDRRFAKIAPHVWVTSLDEWVTVRLDDDEADHAPIYRIGGGA